MDKPIYTRIDLCEIPATGAVNVLKWAEGWTASTPAAERGQCTTMPLPEMCAWLEAHGWTVHRWPGGARAWKGAPLPVRTRQAILRLRDQMQLNRQRFPADLQTHALDLAYDY